MIGNHWQPMSLLNKASYCFYVGIQLSHNRLVAGSNPAGATKFSDINHAVKPPSRGGLFVSTIQLSPFCPLRFSYIPAEQMKLKIPNPHI